MRAIIMLVTLVLAATSSFAQVPPKGQSTAHLAFRGVPIDGTLSSYVATMAKNGFTQVDSEDGYALLKGDFASYKNCFVAVETLKQQDVVSKIAVMFPFADTWPSLSANYFSLKEMLIKEYGSPSDQVEKFKGATAVDDVAKMDKVKSGNVEYYTTFETLKGSIQLSIEHDRSQKCFVQLAYYDKINSEDL